jgi:hypothetical protein
VFSGRRGAHLWLVKQKRDAMTLHDLKQLTDVFIPRLQTAEGVVSAYRKFQSDNVTNKYASWFDRVNQYGKLALGQEDLWKKGENTINYLTKELGTLLGRPIEPSASFFGVLAESGPVEELFWTMAGLLLIAPRLDKGVTSAKSHLLKAPFSLHPKTQLVSLPFDPFDDASHARDNICCPARQLSEDGIVRTMFISALALFESRFSPS